MTAKIIHIANSYVTMEVFQFGMSKGQYHIEYKNIKQNNLYVGQEYNVVQADNGELNFWLK